VGEQRYQRTPDGELVSPARQAKKARKLSARQEKKWRKEQRRKGFKSGRLDRFGNTVFEL